MGWTWRFRYPDTSTVSLFFSDLGVRRGLQQVKFQLEREW